jgi:prevent-host-death family protein
MGTTFPLEMLMAKLAQTAKRDAPMKVMAAGKAKNAFGFLIDMARSEPVTIEKHGRPVAVVLSVEEFERLKARSDGAAMATNAVATDLEKERK